MTEHGSQVFGSPLQILVRDFLIKIGVRDSGDYLIHDIPNCKITPPIGVDYREDDKPMPVVGPLVGNERSQLSNRI